MGDVTGPISTLPGHRHKLPSGATCDDHPDRPAVARIQGETDSFKAKSDESPAGTGNIEGGFFDRYEPSEGNQRNPLRNVPGCYLVIHKETGGVYVGSTKSLSDRSNSTRSSLRIGGHKNKNLQELYNRNPEIEIYVQPTLTELEARSLEQLVVDELKGSPVLCNVATTDVVNTRTGCTLTDDHRAILLAASLGKKRTDEARQHMREAHLGKTLSEEQKQKLSTVHKERLSTVEGKASHARGIDKISNPVICDGVRYKSKSEAARALGLDVTTVMNRIKSPNFPGFKQE